MIVGLNSRVVADTEIFRIIELPVGKQVEECSITDEMAEGSLH